MWYADDGKNSIRSLRLKKFGRHQNGNGCGSSPIGGGRWICCQEHDPG